MVKAAAMNTSFTRDKQRSVAKKQIAKKISVSKKATEERKTPNRKKQAANQAGEQAVPKSPMAGNKVQAKSAKKSTKPRTPITNKTARKNDGVKEINSKCGLELMELVKKMEFEKSMGQVKKFQVKQVEPIGVDSDEELREECKAQPKVGSSSLTPSSQAPNPRAMSSNLNPEVPAKRATIFLENCSQTDQSWSTGHWDCP